MRVLIPLALAASVTGCFAPSIGEGEISCDPDRKCPPGFMCAADGKCYKNPPSFDDGGGTVDAEVLPPDAAPIDTLVLPPDARIDAPPPGPPTFGILSGGGYAQDPTYRMQVYIGEVTVGRSIDGTYRVQWGLAGQSISP